MTIHVARLGEDRAACGATEVTNPDVLILWDEAIRFGGRHFDCVDCHKALTGARKHVEPEGEDQ